MRGPWGHRCAILLAAVAFLSVFTGTVVTSNEERPLYSLGQTHIWLGAATAVLTVALVVSIRAQKERLWLGRLCWIALGAVAVQAFLGLLPLPQAPAVRIAHAFIAQLFFPAAVAIAVCTSAAWKNVPKPAEGPSFLLLLANCTPFLVLAQVALGTLFRHGALGVGPHLTGAFVLIFFILGLALPVIYRPEVSSLRLAAQCFLTIASVQVVLGLALFTMQIMDADPTAIILVTTIHAATGALTLAVTVIMALLIRRTTVMASAKRIVP